MRYKVKVEARADFDAVRKAAEALTRVFVVSEGRRTLSVGDLSEPCKRQLVRLGAHVAPELRYDEDRSAA